MFFNHFSGYFSIEYSIQFDPIHSLANSFIQNVKNEFFYFHPNLVDNNTFNNLSHMNFAQEKKHLKEIISDNFT